MQKQRLKSWSAGLAIAVSMTIFYFRIVERSPDFEARPNRALGEALAEQALQNVGSGGRITLIAPDTSVFQNPAVNYQLEAFYRALRKAKQTVSATNLLKLDPIRLPRVPQELFEILRKQPEADVVVSWLGPMTLNADQKARLPRKHPRVVAICSGWMPHQINLKLLFDDGLLDVAILSRPTPSSVLPKTDDLKDWFAHFFQIVTPKNISDLPPFPDNPPR